MGEGPRADRGPPTAYKGSTPGIPVLDDPTRHARPYAWFSFDEALPASTLDALRALFDLDLVWNHHQTSFYEALLCDVTDRLDPTLLTALVQRMRALTGLPLTELMSVTVQRMERGHRADPHSDRPLVGYEAVRLILQLNPGWRVEDGGLFGVHGSETGPPVGTARVPRQNSAVAFVLTPGSYHSVTPVAAATRRSMVFNFWHAGNTPEVAALVAALFDGRSFAELPPSLDPIAMAAEAVHPDQITHRASLAALALVTWGLEPELVLQGYRWVLGEDLALSPELDVAAPLAAWAARLHVEDFDLARWQRLCDRLALLRVERFPRLRAPLTVLVPGV